MDVIPNIRLFTDGFTKVTEICSFRLFSKGGNLILFIHIAEVEDT